MSLHLLISFVVASVIVALAPGPDILTVVTRSVAQGVWAGIVATCGFASGLVFHTAVAATGLSLLLQHSRTAQHVVQWGGAIYLLYLAYRMIRSRDPVAAEAAGDRRALLRIFGQSVLMNVLNPKVTLFFLAFLPQFVQFKSAVPAWVQFVVYGALFAATTLLVFGACALFAGTLTGFLRKRPQGARPLRVLAAAVFVGIAVSIVAWG